jgi:hypothetical protein
VPVPGGRAVRSVCTIQTFCTVGSDGVRSGYWTPPSQAPHRGGVLRKDW